MIHTGILVILYSNAAIDKFYLAFSAETFLDRIDSRNKNFILSEENSNIGNSQAQLFIDPSRFHVNTNLVFSWVGGCIFFPILPFYLWWHLKDSVSSNIITEVPLRRSKTKTFERNPHSSKTDTHSSRTAGGYLVHWLMAFLLGVFFRFSLWGYLLLSCKYRYAPESMFPILQSLFLNVFTRYYSIQHLSRKQSLDSPKCIPKIPNIQLNVTMC